MNQNQNDNRQAKRQQLRKRKPRMSFKEKKEAELIQALADFHDKEDAKSKPATSPKSVRKPKPQIHGVEHDIHKEVGKTVVYVDGENAFYTLFDTLRRKRLVKYREDLVKFDMRGLLEEVLSDMGPLTIRYYGTKLQEFSDTPELLERTQRMIDHKNRWIGFLSNQDIDFIEAGRLVIRNKGTRNEPDLTFEEKGIDVTLAVDMVDGVIDGHAGRLILWSSDSDFKPAVHVCEKHGADVIYFSHERHINDVLAGTAKGVKTFNNKQITEAFNRVN